MVQASAKAGTRFLSYGNFPSRIIPGEVYGTSSLSGFLTISGLSAKSFEVFDIVVVFI